MKCNLVFLIFLCSSACQLQAQDIWQSLHGPKGVEGQVLAFNNANDFYISVPFNGIYHTADGGETWLKIQKGLARGNSFANSMATSQDGWLYAIIEKALYRLKPGSEVWQRTTLNFSTTVVEVKTTANGSVYVYEDEFGEKLYYSTDHAESFKNFPIDTYYSSSDNIILSGNNKNFIISYSNGKKGIFKFNDDGLDMRLLKEIDPNINIYNIFYDNKGYVFGYSSFDGIYRMDEDGSNFKFMGSLPNNEKPNLLLSGTDGSIVAITYNKDYVSKDSGMNWSERNTNYGKFISSGYFFEKYLGDTTYISADACAASVKFQRTLDGGKNWKVYDENWENNSIEEFLFANGGHIFAKSCDKVFSSNDNGLSWNLIKNSLMERDIKEIGVNKLNEWFTIFDSELYRSTDNGKNWTNTGLTFFLTDKIYSNGTDLLIIKSGIGEIHISNDGGRTWLMYAFKNVDDVYLHSVGSIFVYNSFIGLNVSNDFGHNWTKIPLGIELVTMNILPDGTIYFTGNSQHGVGEDGLYYTDDKFKTVNFINPNLIRVFARDKKANLYGTDNSNSVIKSKDGGELWTDYHSGIPGGAMILNLAIDKDDYLYAGLQSNAIYKTVLPVSQGVNTSEHKKSSLPSVQYDSQNERLRLNWKEIEITNLSYQILNMQGQLLKSGFLVLGQEELSVSGLFPGIYNFKLGTKNISTEGFRFAVLK